MNKQIHVAPHNSTTFVVYHVVSDVKVKKKKFLKHVKVFVPLPHN